MIKTIKPGKICDNVNCKFQNQGYGFVCYGLKKKRNTEFTCDYKELEKLYGRIESNKRM